MAIVACLQLIIWKMGCGAVNPNHVDEKPTTTPVLTLNRIYERKELIGSGTFGKVYRCINKLNGQEYALKVVEITAKNKEEAVKQINNLKSQIGVLKKLNHDNIVKYYSFDISEDNKQVEIVLEYAKQGSLRTLLQQKGTFNEQQASQKTSQILEGLKYLHEQNIVHRDLKCANILVMEDGTLKISDFGTAKSIKINSNQDIAKLCSSLKGTPYYMAPEILRRTGHNISADIWSLGCLVIQMISGKAPWTALTSNFEQIISYIVSGIHPPFPKNLSNQCQCFLQSCLDNVPSQRLNSSELLKHRWIDHTSLSKFEKQAKSKEALTTKTKDGDFYDEISDEREDSRLDKRVLRQQKYKQIDNYVSQKNKTLQKRKGSSQRESAKPKKDRGASIKMTDDRHQNEEYQIEVVPHIDSEVSIKQNNNIISSKKEEGLKITKTAPLVKLPENLIGQLQSIEEQTIELHQDIPSGLKKQTTASKLANSVTTKMKTQTTGKQGGKDFIDTMISRQERNRYLEQQKQLREQREQEKRKWERELQEGANFLRKEMTNRYNI